MNKKKIRKLIEHLENLPDDKFGMDHYAKTGKKCNTVCCIAGTICIIEGLEKQFDFHESEPVNGFDRYAEYLKDERQIFQVAKELLNLELYEANWLFYGEFSRADIKKISKNQAIEALKFLLRRSKFSIIDLPVLF